MLTVLRAVGLALLSAVVLFPFPESIMALRPEINQWSGSSWLVPLGLAYLVSLVQMSGEYWLAGKAAGRGLVRIGRWWEHSSIKTRWDRFWETAAAEWPMLWAAVRPFLVVVAYVGMFGCSVNPIPGTPASRVTAIGMWRTTKLPGAGFVIAGATLIRLLMMYPAIAAMRAVLAP